MSRRYSDADLDRIRRVQELTHEGLTLAGVARVLELEAQVEQLRRRLEQLSKRSAQSTALVPFGRDLMVTPHQVVESTDRPDPTT